MRNQISGWAQPGRPRFALKAPVFAAFCAECRATGAIASRGGVSSQAVGSSGSRRRLFTLEALGNGPPKVCHRRTLPIRPSAYLTTPRAPCDGRRASKKQGTAASSATTQKATVAGSDTSYKKPMTALPRNQNRP